jgi:hypothetical protein
MTVPTVATYSAAALIAAHTSFRDLIDSGSGAGFVRIRNSSDTLLAQVPLSDPCGSVNGTTGVLTITAPSATNASASGTAAYAELCTSGGTVHLSLPAQAGTTAVDGKVVINTLALVSGAPVSVVSIVIT